MQIEKGESCPKLHPRAINQSFRGPPASFVLLCADPSPLLTFGLASKSRRSAQKAFVNPAKRVAIRD
jgi:hypothetical protein